MVNIEVALAVTGGLFALFIILAAATSGYLYFWCDFQLQNDTSTFELNQVIIKSKPWWRRKRSPQVDLEKAEGHPATIGNPATALVDDDNGMLLVTLSTDTVNQTTKPLEDLHKMLATFDTSTDGLLEVTLSSSRRPSNTIQSIEINKDTSRTYHQTIVVIPSLISRQYITDQYDTFSKTVILQSMIEDSLNPKTVVFRKVRDPYLDALIAIGGLVVVAKPFHGKNEFDFHHLLPGDLLRVVKFYVRDDPLDITKSLLLKKGEEEEKVDESSNETLRSPALENPMMRPPPFIDRSDANYPNIYCSGIKLETFLEYDDNNKSIKLKLANTPQVDPETLRDFPLSIVTLETTILEQCE